MKFRTRSRIQVSTRSIYGKLPILSGQSRGFPKHLSGLDTPGHLLGNWVRKDLSSGCSQQVAKFQGDFIDFSSQMTKVESVSTNCSLVGCSVPPSFSTGFMIDNRGY